VAAGKKDDFAGSGEAEKTLGGELVVLDGGGRCGSRGITVGGTGCGGGSGGGGRLSVR